MKILLISRKEVEEILSMKEVMEAVETAFKYKALGKVQMPPKTYVMFPKGDFRTMPCYIPDFGFGGVKIVNVHPENPEKYKLPTIMALIILIEPETGKPLAIMDGTWITNMRTGAAGGVAAKYLARKDSKIIGMVGAGTQARSQLLALNLVYKIDEVKIYAKKLESCERFKKDMAFLGLNISIKEKAQDAVRGCDILVTTTPVTQPIIENEWIDEGVHINAIGADAPLKEELDPRILKRAKIVVDDIEQACHSGEINVPISKGIISRADIYAELGEIIAGKKVGRVTDSEITIFDSTGLAIQDIATALIVYKKAKEQGLGSEVELL